MIKYCRDCKQFERDRLYSFGYCKLTGEKHEGDDSQCSNAANYISPCIGCKFEPDMPSHVKCCGCARMYPDRYIKN